MSKNTTIFTYDNNGFYKTEETIYYDNTTNVPQEKYVTEFENGIEKARKSYTYNNGQWVKKLRPSQNS